MQGSAQEKKKKCVSTQKTLKISKKLSPKTSETVNGLSQHKFPDLWDRGSIVMIRRYHSYQVKYYTRLFYNVLIYKYVRLVYYYVVLKVTSEYTTTVSCRKLWNVSCEYDRLNGSNSTLQAAWYIRHVRWACFFYISFIIWYFWTKPTTWLIMLSFTIFTEGRSRVFYI